MVQNISTLSSNEAIVAHMLDLQTQVNTDQQELSSGLKSQDYVGLAPDASQLLSIEGQLGRLSNYMTNNALVTTKLQTQLTAVQGIDTQATTIQSALVKLAGQDLSSQSPADMTAVKDIQDSAFSALNQISYFLNQQVDGQYIFGGAQQNAPPVSFPYTSLAGFQQTFNGISTVFPTTAVADSTNMGFDNVPVTYTPTTINGTNYTEVDGSSPDQFVTQTLTTAGFGGSVRVTSSPNSEVLPFGSVAVALIASPAVSPKLKVAEKVALPLEFVMTEIDPR